MHELSVTYMRVSKHIYLEENGRSREEPVLIPAPLAAETAGPAEVQEFILKNGKRAILHRVTTSTLTAGTDEVIRVLRREGAGTHELDLKRRSMSDITKAHGIILSNTARLPLPQGVMLETV